LLIAGVLALTAAGGAYYYWTEGSSVSNPSQGSVPAEPGPLEILPFDGKRLESAGTRDFKNKYSSTVMVTTKGPLEVAECSGVIISPRLVLTAGHCVCKPDTIDATHEAKTTSIDSAKCTGQANAITLLYGTVRSALMADFKVRVYTGAIRPHPELRLVFDDSGTILSARADLAVLFLDEPVEDGIPSAVLADTEIRTDEPLVMAGYGYDKNMGGIYGARYFRTNKLARGHAPSSGRFTYEQQGPYVYDGFSGGPCFRENGAGRWLAGISSVGTEKELSFTSTAFFGAWIRFEIQRALK
jgi:hypothetical protein